MAKTRIKGMTATSRESARYKIAQKRCLIGLQKGVSKGLKGHLLQVKRALIRRVKSMYKKRGVTLFLQNRLLGRKRRLCFTYQEMGIMQIH